MKEGLFDYIRRGFIVGTLWSAAVALLVVAGVLVREFLVLPSYRSYIMVGIFLSVITLSNLLARSARYIS